ncbi:hypothetical protein [Halopelagius fulvigenes]|uniref:Uncharacterized protein n=1 Tax=Halopelagius fulvigenes TaxID=1198324 RepID=A0ABD5TYE7_9EURY
MSERDGPTVIRNGKKLIVEYDVRDAPRRRVVYEPREEVADADPYPWRRVEQVYDPVVEDWMTRGQESVTAPATLECDADMAVPI